MPDQEEKEPQVGKQRANFVSRLFFWWINGIVREGYRGNLGQSSIDNVLYEDEAQVLGAKAAVAYKIALSALKPPKNANPRVLKTVIWKLFVVNILMTGSIKLVQDCIVRIGTPLALAYLIRYFNGEVNQITGIYAAFGIIVGQIIGVLMEHAFFLRIEHLGMKIRISFSALVYQKILKLQLGSSGGSMDGHVMNLVANDLNRFDCIQHIHVLWVGIFQVLITVLILWNYFGIWCLSGLTLLFLHLPLQGILGKAMTVLRMKIMTRTDKRVQLMKEILGGIRAIKIYCWELVFTEKAAETRKNEMNSIKTVTWLRSLNWSLYYTSTKVAVFATVTVYVWFENHLSAESVFVAVALYNNIRVTITLLYPCGIAQLADVLIALERIEKFLNTGEIQKNKCKALPALKLIHQHAEKNDKQLRMDESLSEERPQILCRNLSVTWGNDSEAGIKADLSIDSGKLVTIIGSVGGGKSTLLKALLQEFSPSSGSVQVTGKVSYAAQEPWIFGGTIRENILFGNVYDNDRYHRVVDACQLQRDFELLAPYGDMTLIGDCGTSLSGGQKARINLARAVYTVADVYLLDDPLSAVDASVGRKIFQQCIRGLLHDTTRIVVTHQLQFANQADEVYSIEKGVLAVCDDFKHLSEKEINENNNNMKKYDEEAGGSQNTSEKGSVSDLSEISLIDALPETDSVGNESVKSGTYWKYLHCGTSYFSLFLLLVLNLITQTLHTGSDYWLQMWCRAHQSVGPSPNYNKTEPFLARAKIYRNNQTTTTSSFLTIDLNDPRTDIIIYSLIIGSLFLFSMLRTLGFFRLCISSSTFLYRAMLSSVVRAPMKFFEDHSTGHIMNRFTKDTDIMDDALPQTMFETIEICLNVVGIVTLVCIINPYILIPTFFLSFPFYFLFIIYVRSARILKRLEANARSPIYTHVSSTLNGLVTIRAHDAQKVMQVTFNQCLNNHSSLWYLTIAMTRWIAMWLDWVCVTFVAVVIAILMVSGNVGGATAGMAISSVMFTISVFQWGVRQAGTVEMQMVSVERIIEFAKLTSEGMLETTTEKKPPSSWPSEGQIAMKNVSLSCGDAMILRDVNLTMQSKEKIGVVGRTGAGKTSLINSLLRLIEPSGSIEIDGFRTSNLGLHDLRSKISVIPQDPFLFHGTLRDNLCISLAYTDEELWSSLKSVGLAPSIADAASGLSAEVQEGGLNYSVGQRQLFCLARAILQKNKILIMDEATANVDLGTDKLVQETIREKFKDCTVITIAHRLFTVMDCDRILVMDGGRVNEFDTPRKLLQNPNGLLSSMVIQTGPESAEILRNMAETHSKTPNNQ